MELLPFFVPCHELLNNFLAVCWCVSSPSVLDWKHCFNEFCGVFFPNYVQQWGNAVNQYELFKALSN